MRAAWQRSRPARLPTSSPGYTLSSTTAISARTSTLMKIGMLQIIVAMIEAERIDAARILEDPVAAVLAWSRDPTLAAAAHTAAGRPTTAVELLGEFWEDARAFVDEGGCVAASCPMPRRS